MNPLKEFRQSYLWYRWNEHVRKPPSNDFVIAISASGKSSMSRTGKTTLETFLAEEFNYQATGNRFDAETQSTLDAGTLAYDIVPEVPNHSAVCMEEAQGSAGTVGLDARRGMKQEAIDAINAILNNGNKQLTIIITAQHMPMLDKRIPPLVDAWILIRHGPSSPDGPLAIHHGMHVEDYNFGDPKIKTPAYEDIVWPKVNEINPNYQILEEKKETAKQKHGGEDAEDKELPKQVQARIAQQFRDLGKSLKWIENNVGEVTYSSEWVRQNTVADSEKESA
jgi:hypothetical protein